MAKLLFASAGDCLARPANDKTVRTYEPEACSVANKRA